MKPLICCFIIWFCLMQKVINYKTYLVFYKNVIQKGNMKRVLFLSLFSPLLIIAQSSVNTQNIGTEEGLVITGKITGLPENSVVYFAGNNENDTIAKAAVKQDSFELKARLDNVDGGLLIFSGLNKKLFLFIGNEHVNITASNTELKILLFLDLLHMQSMKNLLMK